MKIKKFKEISKNRNSTFICDHCLKYKCSKCLKVVFDHQKGMCFDICENWIHSRRANLSRKDYQFYQDEAKLFYCKACLRDNFPFSDLNDLQFMTYVPTKLSLEERLNRQPINHLERNVLYAIKD